MGRAFSTDEKQTVRKRIQGEGVRLFTRMGIRKTTVRDITAAAGDHTECFRKTGGVGLEYHYIFHVGMVCYR